MRSKQVQILSGICGVQLIGYACRAAGFKTDIWIGFAGSVFLMLDIVYLAIQEKGRKKDLRRRRLTTAEVLLRPLQQWPQNDSIHHLNT